MDATLVGQGLLSGFLFGGVYSLMAVGLTLIFGVMRVVNFAHGDMMVWGMYLAFVLSTRAGIDPYVSFVVCAAALFVLGVAVQRGLVDRILAAPHTVSLHPAHLIQQEGPAADAGHRLLQYLRIDRMRQPCTDHLRQERR